MNDVFDLTIATDHAAPYVWLAVLAAHAAIGAALWGAFVILGLTPRQAAITASVAYLSAWEIAVQGIGAGLSDTVVDWAAVTFGALAAWGLWSRLAWQSILAVIFWGAMALVGVRKRL